MFTGLLIETFYPQTLTQTSDGQGGFTEAWTDGTPFRGRLSSLSSYEKMSSNKIILDSSHKLFCDWSSYSPTSRIRNATRYFTINGLVNPSNINHHLEIFLKEVDTNG